MSLYKDRVAAGLCGMCGQPPVEGKALCQVCLDKSRARAAQRRAARRDSAGCLTCGTPISQGTRCESCKASAKASRQRSVARRKAAGTCTACSNPAKPGCTLCQQCIDSRSRVSSEHYQKRREAGTCLFCSSPPVVGKTLCEYHQQKYAGYRQQLKLEALAAYGGPVCVGCGSTDVGILEIDHIAGGGRKHFREEGITGGYSFYLWLRKQGYPSGYRVLCPSCNKKAHRKEPLPLG